MTTPNKPATTTVIVCNYIILYRCQYEELLFHGAGLEGVHQSGISIPKSSPCLWFWYEKFPSHGSFWKPGLPTFVSTLARLHRSALEGDWIWSVPRNEVCYQSQGVLIRQDPIRNSRFKIMTWFNRIQHDSNRQETLASRSRPQSLLLAANRSRSTQRPDVEMRKITRVPWYVRFAHECSLLNGAV